MHRGFYSLMIAIMLLFLTPGISHAAGQINSEWQAEVVSVMDKEALEAMYQYPYVVGDIDEEIAAWPLFQQEVTGLNRIGYIYESISFSSIPGFMGVPYNVLVTLDNEGAFIDINVLYHREPMFMGGIGEQPLFEFVEQYQGLSLTQSIKFRENHHQRSDNSGNIYIDGISGATASVRVLNQTLLSSALKIARARLGFGIGKSPEMIAKIDNDVFSDKQWHELVESGLIHQTVLNQDDVDSLFADSKVANLRDAFDPPSDTPVIDIHITDLMIPSVGKNLLAPALWDALNQEMEDGDHAILVVSTGHYSFKHASAQRGGISDRLTLRQEGLPIEMRDIDFEERLDTTDPLYTIQFPEEMNAPEWMIYRVLAAAGLDIALPLEFSLSVSRGENAYIEPVIRHHSLSYRIPDAYYFEPQSHDTGWQSIWLERAWDIGLLVIAVLTLFFVLSKPHLLTSSKQHTTYFRTGYLLFTLFFIGWYAQGQLSIVNLTGSIQSLMAGGGLGFFLYDPITTLLWCFVFVSFFFWGRGTFCGWLCPFGALQELVTNVLSPLGISQIKPSYEWDRRLKYIKYVILFLIISTAFVSPDWSNQLVEFEPFKTSITFFFVRSWPFVIWAVALVAFSLFVYKGYCRYLCPLGGAMAVLGKFRLFNWLTRRSECGSPCQRCRHSCEYGSIEKSGAIDYNECFQCLDCVVIHDSDELCVPLIIQHKNNRKLKSKTKTPSLIASSQV